MDTPEQVVTPTSYELTPEERAIVAEVGDQMLQSRLKTAGLKEQVEAEKERMMGLQNHLQGAVRMVLRTRQLEGSWAPTGDYTRLVRQE